MLALRRYKCSAEQRRIRLSQLYPVNYDIHGYPFPQCLASQLDERIAIWIQVCMTQLRQPGHFTDLLLR